MRGPEHALLATAVQLLGQLVTDCRAQKGNAALLDAAVEQMEGDPDVVGVLVAVAYPDRVGMRRDSSNR